MKNILFIAQDTSGLEDMLLSLKENASKNGADLIVLAVGEEVKPVLRKNLKSFIEINDFLSYEENLVIDRFARDWAEEWFKDPKFKGALEYRDINLGCVTMNGFDEYMTWLVKQYMVVKKILDEKDIKEVVVFGDKGGVVLKGDFNDIRDQIASETAKIFCAGKGIDYKAFSAANAHDDKPSISLDRRVKETVKEAAKKCIAALLPVFYSFRKGGAKKKILISSSYMHVKEVMEDLIRSKKYSLLYLRNVFSAKQSLVFSTRGVEYKVFPDKRPTKDTIGKIDASWDVFQKALEKEDTFIFDGFSFDAFMKPRLEIIFKKTFTKIAAGIDYFYDLLEREKVSLIIVEEDVCVFNKGLILTANNLGIKSIVFQHGFLCSVKEFRRAFYPLNGTKIAVWGPLTKEAFLTYGIPEEPIEVVGCPRLGEPGHVLKKDKDGIKRRLGLNTRHKTIFYPDQGLLEEHLHIASGTSNARILTRYVSDVARMVLESDDMQLIIKSHPGLYNRMIRMIKDSDELNGLMEELKKQKRLSIIDEWDILELIAISDLVVYDSTTLGSYALHFNKPVVHYTLMPTLKEPIYFKYDPTYNVNTESDLKKAVARALEFPNELDENRKKYIKEYYHDSPGAVPRAIRLIENMISQEG